MTREEAIRILDPETALQELGRIAYYGGFKHEHAIQKAIDEAVTLAIEALKERPKGRWEFVELKNHPLYGKPHKVGEWRCPFCGRTVAFKPPYCHCGADMRGEEEGLRLH